MLCVYVVSEDVTDQEEMNVDDKEERQDHVNVLPVDSGAIVFDDVQRNMNFITVQIPAIYKPIPLKDCFLLKMYGNDGKPMTCYTV